MDGLILLGVHEAVWLAVLIGVFRAAHACDRCVPMPLRWLNAAMGGVAGWMILTPLCLSCRPDSVTIAEGIAALIGVDWLMPRIVSFVERGRQLSGR